MRLITLDLTLNGHNFNTKNNEYILRCFAVISLQNERARKTIDLALPAKMRDSPLPGRTARIKIRILGRAKK